jgi:YegS/Rv2252/BmrU family lipid kinase
VLKARFIYNPRSGSNTRNPGVIERTRRFIAENAARLDAALVSTTHPRHATTLARDAVAAGCALVVAIGGDGTLNEVAAGLLHTPATLGLIPCGSGNGLGRHLGIPGPGEPAFHTLLHGTPRLIDTGLVNATHPFFNVMGLGFDAEISRRFHALARRGLPAYLRLIAAAWLRYRRPALAIIEPPAARIATRAFILAIANSEQYGNNGCIAPGALLDDGLLDLTLIRRAHPLNALPLALRLLTGKLRPSRNIRRVRAAHFVIERAAPGLIHTDGEPHELPARLEVRVVPRSLRILAPQERKKTPPGMPDAERPAR